MTEEVKRIFLDLESDKREDLIFTDSNRNKIKRPSKIYTAIIDEMGLNEGVTDARQKLTFHSLRHTYASWLVDRGVPLYDVKQLLGHSSIELTQRYSHLSDKRLIEDVKEFERGIKQAGQSKRQKDKGKRDDKEEKTNIG